MNSFLQEGEFYSFKFASMWQSDGVNFDLGKGDILLYVCVKSDFHLFIHPQHGILYSLPLTDAQWSLYLTHVGE